MTAKRKEAPGFRRTRAREQVVKLLFSRDFVPAGEPADAFETAAPVMDDIVLEKYTRELYEGILEHQERIDRTIEAASENWALSRMALTDRSILRIATFELLYRDDIPSGVSINEAVELAQAFGGEDDSYRFVNGVLGKIASSIEEGIDLAAEPAEEPEAAAAGEAAADAAETPAEQAGEGGQQDGQ